MQHAGDFDSVTQHSVDNDIRKWRQHQLVSTLDSTEASAVRKSVERRYCAVDCARDAISS